MLTPKCAADPVLRQSSVTSHHRWLYTWLISQGLFRTREYPSLPTRTGLDAP